MGLPLKAPLCKNLCVIVVKNITLRQNEKYINSVVKIDSEII